MHEVCRARRTPWKSLLSGAQRGQVSGTRSSGWRLHVGACSTHRPWPTRRGPARQVREFNPQALTNMAWAFATAGHAAPALFQAIAAESAGRVRELNPQELANTAWAFATAGHAAPALLEAIAEEASGRVREFTPQALINTAWAFATAGHAAPVLFDAIAAEAAGPVRELNP